MMRFAWPAVIAASLALAGCFGARMVVSSPGGADEARGGVVEYRSRGVGAGGRRADAERLMAKFCQPGSYLIAREHASLEPEPAGDSNDIFVTWTRIHFECQ